MLDIAAACLVTALLAYFNHCVTRLPLTIGVVVISLVVSLAIIALSRLGLYHGFPRGLTDQQTNTASDQRARLDRSGRRSSDNWK